MQVDKDRAIKIKLYLRILLYSNEKYVAESECEKTMIISELKLYDFRRFKSISGKPGLVISFHKGLNALIGENDSGKTAVIDALKLVLLTQSNEYIRPTEEDFYKSTSGEACLEFKIDCTITGFNKNEAKNFIEYFTFKKNGDNVEYILKLHYRAWKERHKIFHELRVGEIDDGISIDGKARELLKAVYLKPLRNAEREMSSGRSSRISQILLNHPVFKDKQEHEVLGIFQDANNKIEEYFTNGKEGKHILQTIRNNLKSFNDRGQASDAELKASDIQLNAILESLSLNAPEINPGLGELNLLFIAAELLFLKDDIDGGIKLALIEELEAHLHPQAQLWLISFLQNEYNENDVQKGVHFPEDARNVVRCWHSVDVSACPSSWKTTVLLAKLKLLADRMPLENGTGICVLSHTNVAVDEIRNRLSDYTDKLFSYPNYIGTIQSFVDKFVTMPYLRTIAERNVQVVDNVTFAQHMLNKMKTVSTYRALNYVTKNSFETGRQYTD